MATFGFVRIDARTSLCYRGSEPPSSGSSVFKLTEKVSFLQGS